MNPNIFRSYDIRGIYGGDLNEQIMKKIAQAFSKYIKNKNIAVARDMRVHSASLKRSFISGVSGSVHDCGLLPMGAAMFYAWKSKRELAYITASHLPKQWNGVKFFHSSGMGFLEKENFAIRNIFLKGSAKSPSGKIQAIDSKKIIEDYKKYLVPKIRPRCMTPKAPISRKLKVAIDCGNGASGLIARSLFEKAGFSVSVVFEELDGTFPNRSPEPNDDNLAELKNEIKKSGAGMGIAYDGDADRMVLVDDKCNIVAPEQAAYLILSELLKKQKGGIVANVECTRIIDNVAGKFKRKITRIPVGHTFLAEAVHSTKAAFGIEPSGHYMLPSVVPYDDALAVSLYAACALSMKNKKLSEIVKDIPKSYFTRINFDCSDDKKFAIIESLKKKLSKEYKINTMDGIRLDFDYGFVLIRASNTSLIIRLTVEAGTKKQLDELKIKFIEILKEEIKIQNGR